MRENLISPVFRKRQILHLTQEFTALFRERYVTIQRHRALPLKHGQYFG
jgi:hypothetical protein